MTSEIGSLGCRALALVLAGVGVLYPHSVEAKPTAASSEFASVPEDSQDAKPAQPPSPLVQVADDNYRLRAGDTIIFKVDEDREVFSEDKVVSLAVMDSGDADFPYLGRLSVSGKTCRELAAELKRLLESDYYQKATVVLSVKTANRFAGRVYILGQVRTQGSIDMQINENLTAGKAILRTGGFGEYANKRKVKVIRGSGSTKGESTTFELDMTKILEGGKVDDDVRLQAEDLIVVPSRLVNF